MVVIVKGTYTVTPSEENPKRMMYVSEFDHLAPITHVPFIYFYRRPSSDLPSNQFDTIKHSVSKVLSTFYPLAGRLQWRPSSSTRRLEINCNSAGALLVEAESDSVIADFGDFCPTAAIAELLPPIDYKSLAIDEQPLLLVQFTRLGCGGVSLGVRISHVVVDATAASHFLLEWARISRGEELQNMPFLDRTVLKPRESSPSRGGYDRDFEKTPLLIGQANSLEERMKETTVVMLRLSKDQVEILRRNCNEYGNINHRPFTSFEVVYAHTWRCASRARGHKNEQQTVIGFPVNFRNRIKPSLPKCYFGNAYVLVVATATAPELLAEPLSYACGRMREAASKVNDEYVESCLSYIKSMKDPECLNHSHVVGSLEGTFLGNPNFSANSWLGFSLQGFDFGWGKDIYVGPGSLGFDGKSFMLPGRGEEEGSVIIPLRLQVAHMDAFKKVFYGDILRNKL